MSTTEKARPSSSPTATAGGNMPSDASRSRNQALHTRTHTCSSASEKKTRDRNEGVARLSEVEATPCQSSEVHSLPGPSANEPEQPTILRTHCRQRTGCLTYERSNVRIPQNRCARLCKSFVWLLLSRIILFTKAALGRAYQVVQVTFRLLLLRKSNGRDVAARIR